MLDKFGVEVPRVCAALAPVQYKFGYGLGDKVGIYVGAMHNLQCVQTGAPAVVQFCGLLHPKFLRLALLLAAPLCSDVLAELVFPGMAGLAALAPIKDEIFQLVQGELSGYGVIHGEQC